VKCPICNVEAVILKVEDYGDVKIEWYLCGDHGLVVRTTGHRNATASPLTYCPKCKCRVKWWVIERCGKARYLYAYHHHKHGEMPRGIKQRKCCIMRI